MEALVISLGAVSGGVAVAFALAFLNAACSDNKEEREKFKAIIPIYGFTGGTIGLLIGTLVAHQQFDVLKWLIIPISAVGTLLVLLALVALIMMLRWLGMRLISWASSLGERFGSSP